MKQLKQPFFSIDNQFFTIVSTDSRTFPNKDMFP